MRLLADENIPIKLIEELRKADHDVLSAEPRTADEEVIGLAKKEKRILLSQDKHLANIVWYPPKNFHGIIRLRFSPPIISDMLIALENLFSKLSFKEIHKH